jgi:hypothetical protein
VGLQIEPALNVCSKEPREPKRRIGGDATPLANDFVDASGRHLKGARESGAGEAHGLHELLTQDLARVNREEFLAHAHFPSVIVDNLNALRPFLRPEKTHSILIIHAEAALSLSIALQRLQTISRRHSQEVECCRGVQLIQFPSSHCFDVHEASDTVSSEQGLRFGAAEGQDQGAGTIS